MLPFVLILSVSVTVCGVLGSWVADQKERSEVEGLVLGVLFGPLGVIIEALLPTLMAARTDGPPYLPGPDIPFEIPRRAAKRKLVGSVCGHTWLVPVANPSDTAAFRCQGCRHLFSDREALALRSSKSE